jgi:general secretion pathway protein A
MYKTFFGLHENPFNINPDPRFLYLTPNIQEALAQLTYGIQNRKGCILLTGEVGTGKTTLVHYLLDWLTQKKMPTAFIFNSHLSTSHLFEFILTEFGIPIDFRLRCNMLLQLTKWLLERFQAGETPVLILDEAQGLSLELLEEVRLLLNLETASEKLLQIVLVGQPELENKLKRPELRQFRQRIALKCRTAPLTLQESYGYITDRLRVAGAKGDLIFAPEAIEAVHFYSRGIPRVMNLLCEHALVNAYVEQLNPVPPLMVEEAARDFLLEEFRPVTTCLGFENHPHNNVSVFQSGSTSDSIHTPTTEEASFPQRLHTTSAGAQKAVALHKPSSAAERSSGTTVTEGAKMSSSEKNQSVAIPLDDLIPTSPKSESKQNERMLSLDSIASPPDSAARLVADMKRLLATVSPTAPVRVRPPRDGNQPLSAEGGNHVAASKNGVSTLNSVNHLPGHSPRTSIYARLLSRKPRNPHWTTRLVPASSLAESGRLLSAVLGTIKQAIYPVQLLLHCWMVGFKHDWIATINAIEFAQTRNSFLHWLRQPISSKPMASSKN